MTPNGAATVRKQVVVDVPIEHAFTVFTSRFGDFKPPEHNLLGSADRRDGVRAPGGRQHRGPGRGRQRVPVGADPGLRTARPGGVQLGHQPAVDDRDRPGADQRGRGARSTPNHRTAPGSKLEHRHIDRHGPGWEAVTGGVDGSEGWPLYLDRYATLAKEGR